MKGMSFMPIDQKNVLDENPLTIVFLRIISWKSHGTINLS